MRFCFLLCLLVFSFQICVAQQFLDKESKPVASKAEATYYRTVEKQGGILVVKDFYCSNDQLAMEAPCESGKGGLKVHGKVASYYENGKLAKESSYSYGERQTQKSYDEDGRAKEEVLYTRDDTKYLQVWSETGDPLLEAGSGIVARYDKEEQTVVYTEYKDSTLYSSFWIRPVQRDTVYALVAKKAEYKGGLAALSQYVGRTLKYPSESRKKNIQGTVFVSFTIDKEGNASEFEVAVGISSDCDEEAMRCIKETSGNWIPARVSDKNVKSIFVQSVKFKIAE